MSRHRGPGSHAWLRALDERDAARARTQAREEAPKPEPIGGVGFSAYAEAHELARQRGGFTIPLWKVFRERDTELVDV